MNPLLEARLKSLQDALNELASGVDDNLRTVLLRLTCDSAVSAAVRMVPIEELARTARERTLLVVAREHPLASDLKFAMATLRVEHDYERINELTVSLNNRIELLVGTPVQEVLQDMTGVMADILSFHAIVRTSWDRGSNRSNDQTEQARTLVSRIHDGIVRAQTRILSSISSGQGTPESFIEIVLACRHLKRIALTMEVIPEEIHSFDRPAATA